MSKYLKYVNPRFYRMVLVEYILKNYRQILALKHDVYEFCTLTYRFEWKAHLGAGEMAQCLRTCRIPGFLSQSPHGSSQLPVTLASGDPMLFLGSLGTRLTYDAIHMCRQNIHTHKNTKNTFGHTGTLHISLWAKTFLKGLLLVYLCT